MDISESAKAFHEHDGDWPSLLHPDIEVKLLITFDRPVTGKDNVVRALTEGRAANLYTGSVSSMEVLDATSCRIAVSRPVVSAPMIRCCTV